MGNSQFPQKSRLSLGFSPKLDILGKKNWGTPNPKVKKLGVTPNPYEFIASAGARAAEAGRGGAKAGLRLASIGRRDKLICVGFTPNYLTCGIGVTPIFLNENIEFSSLPAPSASTHSKNGKYQKKWKKFKTCGAKRKFFSYYFGFFCGGVG